MQSLLISSLTYEVMWQERICITKTAPNCHEYCFTATLVTIKVNCRYAMLTSYSNRHILLHGCGNVSGESWAVGKGFLLRGAAVLKVVSVSNLHQQRGSQPAS